MVLYLPLVPQSNVVAPGQLAEQECGVEPLGERSEARGFIASPSYSTDTRRSIQA
jgi:hypothetical protein